MPNTHIPLVFDRYGALDRFAGDVELLDEIVASAIHDITGLLTLIDEAFATQNTSDVARHLHTIKGASANAGAEAVRSLAATLEHSAKQTDLTTVSRNLDQLKQAVAEFINAAKSK